MQAGAPAGCLQTPRNARMREQTALQEPVCACTSCRVHRVHLLGLAGRVEAALQALAGAGRHIKQLIIYQNRD